MAVYLRGNMNWKALLTNTKKMLGLGPKKRASTIRPEHEPIPPVISIDEAVESLPEDLIKHIRDKKFTGVRPVKEKLDEKMQLELMELIARYATGDEINEHFYSHYKVIIRPSMLYQYKRSEKWKPVIAKFREKYLLNPSEVAMSHKRVRLDRREKIYQAAMKKEDLKTANSVIQGAKEEMEETGRGSISLTFNQYNALSDDELKDQIKEKLERLKRFESIDVKPAKPKEQ